MVSMVAPMERVMAGGSIPSDGTSDGFTSGAFPSCFRPRRAFKRARMACILLSLVAPLPSSSAPSVVLPPPALALLAPALLSPPLLSPPLRLLSPAVAASTPPTGSSAAVVAIAVGAASSTAAVVGTGTGTGIVGGSRARVEAGATMTDEDNDVDDSVER